MHTHSAWHINKLKDNIVLYNQKIHKKIGFFIDEIFILLNLLLIASLILIRCQYGLEITDEAYYYGDAVMALKGNLPYVYNISNQIQAGMMLLMIIPLCIYKFFVPSLEGVFLYMRVCYVIYMIAMVLIIYLILRKRFSRKALLAAVCILLSFSSSINSFSYNTVSFWSGVTSATLVSEFCSFGKNKIRVVLMMSAGFLSAIATFAHPLYAPSIIVLSILILVYSQKGYKVYNLIGYYIGGIIEVAIVFVPIIIQVGLTKFCESMRIIFFERVDIGVVAGVYGKFDSFFSLVLSQFLRLLLESICLLLFYCVIKCFRKTKYSYQSAWLLSVGIATLIESIKIYRDAPTKPVLAFSTLAVSLILLTGYFVRDKIIVFIGFSCVVFFFFEVAIPTGDAIGRTYFLYPILFCIILLLIQKSHPICMYSWILVAMTISLFMIKAQFNFVYRDGEAYKLGLISGETRDLTYRVPSGIYKGLLTVKENSDSIIEVEDYIRKNTCRNEKVSFRDNVPFAHIMSEGMVSDIRAWDELHYSYRKGLDVDNPINIYKYYKLRNEIPDKYIYIDFGRDDILSCDENDWSFNLWLNSYYKLVNEEKINDQFSAKIYEYAGGFNGDYEYWIDICGK